jgi:hypothetical protein
MNIEILGEIIMKSQFRPLPKTPTSKKTTESTKMPKGKGKMPKKAITTLKNMEDVHSKPIKAPGVQANGSKKVDSLKPGKVTKKMKRVSPCSK